MEEEETEKEDDDVKKHVELRLMEVSSVPLSFSGSG
jgi:hypothetical protein|uniref:Uncharacterized protein n=1 Tax=Arabidopsis thaliana TaxID=3702 RepID=Q0WRE4_ARATH|nr:hypothetical protein [Arabidopsis thaliana]